MRTRTRTDDLNSFTNEWRDQSPSVLCERRNHVRVILNIPVTVAGQDHVWHKGTLIDISTGGAQLLIENSEPCVETTLTASFRLGTEHRLIADVIWYHRTEREFYLIGLQWTGPGNVAREHLTQEIMRIAVSRRRLKRR